MGIGAAGADRDVFVACSAMSGERQMITHGAMGSIGVTTLDQFHQPAGRYRVDIVTVLNTNDDNLAGIARQTPSEVDRPEPCDIDSMRALDAEARTTANTLMVNRRFDA